MGADGNSDGAADLDDAIRRGDLDPQFFEDAPTDAHRVFPDMRSVGGQQKRELVAADAGHEVAASQDRAKLGCDLLQQRVAGLVAERIVHFLETVEIDEKQAAAGPAPWLRSMIVLS